MTITLFATPSMTDGPVQQTVIFGPNGFSLLAVEPKGQRLLLASRAPLEVLTVTRNAFSHAVLATAAGDSQASAALDDLAQQFLDASRHYNASGMAFQTDHEVVRKAYEDLGRTRI